jgi:2-octaprenyl-3-methyl-6-methoxy-1,4-benzoquinol hydroxylase
MVGALLACALGDSSLQGNASLKVALVETRQPDGFDPAQSHDLRVSAISLASQQMLKAVGAWSGVEQRRLCPYRRMRVWEWREKGDAEFDSHDVDEPCLGHIVENRVIQLALLERLATFSNVDLFCPVTPDKISYSPEGSQIVLDSGVSLKARLMIGADGGFSRVRESAGIGINGWDYEQHALVVSVVTAGPQQEMTWQRFYPDGPRAFLPLSGPHASLVWYDRPAKIKQLQNMQGDALIDALHDAFPRELGGIERILDHGYFPLRRQHAQRYVKEGVALIGDAAHMIHPLAGQGANIGLLDAGVLSEELLKAAQAEEDIGAVDVLKRFEQRRRKDNLLVMTSMDLLYRVFRSDQPLLKLGRNLGLHLANSLGSAKRRAMRVAMGLEGDLPELAKRSS